MKKTEIRIQTYEVLVIREKGARTQGEPPGCNRETGTRPRKNGPATQEPSAEETIPNTDPPAHIERRTLSLSSWINGILRKGRPVTATQTDQASHLRMK